MNIIKAKYLWFLISGILIIFSISVFFANIYQHGKIMNFGIDFTGGTLINLRFSREVSTAEIRKVLENFNLSQSVIQVSQKRDVFIRSEPLDVDLRVAIVEKFREELGEVLLLEADTIGPVIGKELSQHAIWALIIASIGIIIYVSFRFEFKYALAALIALFHDALIAAGIMALLWRTIDVSFVAGILTIMGYSINDTIVIFDRIRENFKKLGTKQSFSQIVNKSLLETMARSINTVLTVLIMVLALLFFGGQTLKNFCLVLLIGFFAGTYSSIFLASPIIVFFQEFPKRSKGK